MQPLITAFSYTDDIVQVKTIAGEVAEVLSGEDMQRPRTAKRKPCGQPGRKTSTIFEYTGQNTSNHTIKRFLPSNG